MQDLKMSEAAKSARAAYMKRWRAANPERLRAYQAAYWERKAAESCGESEQLEGSKEGDR